MDSMKQQYLSTVRSNTAYPTYRGMIGAIAALGYALAVLAILGGVISGCGAMNRAGVGGFLVSILGGILIGGVFVLLARLWKEASLVLVDMGDAILEQGARGVGAETPGAAQR